MQKTFAIGIPTINRADLLNESLAKYVRDFPSTFIFICDNGHQNIFSHPNICTTVQDDNLGVAKSWNFLADQIFTIANNAIIINDDIYWGKTEAEVIEFISMNLQEDFIVAPGTWCNFILPQRTYLETGKFDTDFINAYYEDNDYHYRMKLLNKSYFASPFLSPAIYRNSMSIQKDPLLNGSFGHNKERYIRKWGGLPTEETFSVPFNIPN